jgi:TPR repeat protein
MARLGHMLAGGDPAALAHFAEQNPNHTRDAPVAAAMRWFRRAQAAEGGGSVPSALLGMATLHLYGNGTAVNHAKAFELLSAVAKAGETAEAEVAEAKYLLGVMWANGWGVSEKSDV